MTTTHFEAKNDESRCEDIIVGYSRGGQDNGVTERYMRRACHLEEREPADETMATVAGVAVETDASTFLLQAPQDIIHKQREFTVALLHDMRSGPGSDDAGIFLSARPED